MLRDGYETHRGVKICTKNFVQVDKWRMRMPFTDTAEMKETIGTADFGSGS